MLEDKPHNLGRIIVGVLIEQAQNTELTHNPIIIGVVNHRKSTSYMEELASHISRVAGKNDIGITYTGPQLSEMFLRSDNFSLNVVQLPDYSYDAGSEFGQKLQEQM